jgi:ubiquinone biosynthesis monooxygenase Coq7
MIPDFKQGSGQRNSLKVTGYQRKFSATDRIVAIFDDALRTVFGHPERHRPSPAADCGDDEDTTDKEHSAQLMRVNHSGEICAQALYQAQAITARSESVRNAMGIAANEENDHLNWCEERLHQLDSHKSYLNPAWYCGSFVIGTAFGIAGDRWSLGFLEETERQVVKHLEGHLKKLPADDLRSRAIVKQMQEDEASHATQAANAGARELPPPLKRLMSLAAKIMTTTAAKI